MDYSEDEEILESVSVVEDGESLDSSTDGESEEETPDIEESEGSQAEDAPEGGRVRGPDGKFAKKAADPEGDAELSEGEPAEAPPTEETPKVPQGRPVQIKADGELYDLPGATQRDDGTIELNAQGFDLVHRYVGQAVVSQKKIAKLTAENQQLATQRTQKDEYNEKLGERYAELAQLALDDPEQAIQLLQGFAQQLPTLQAQMEAAHWRQVAEQRDRQLQPDPQVVQYEQEEALKQSLNEGWSEAMQSDWAKELTPEDQQQLVGEIWAIREIFKVVATKDVPEYDVRQGEVLFHRPKMLETLENRARYIIGLRKSSQRVAQVAKKSVTPTVVAPPMGAKKAVGSGAAGTVAKQAKTREDWARKNLGI